MDITFNSLRSKEVVNLYDGKQLGRIIDVSFDKRTGRVLGFIMPGIKKIFKKSEDLFIPLDQIKKIGDDVILVSLTPEKSQIKSVGVSSRDNSELKTYVRYKRVERK